MLYVSQRYLAAKFIPPFVISAMFFIMFLLTFELFKIIHIIISRGVAFTLILELTFHIAISFVPIAIPLSTLFATIYSINQLSSDSEVVAMRSFGISKYKLFLPFLILSILIAAMTYHLGQNVIPLSKKLFKNKIISISSKGMLSNLKSGEFFIDIPGITLFTEEVSDGGKELKNIFLNIDKANSEEKIISAKTGRIIPNSGTDGATRLHLSNGNILTIFNDRTEKVEKIDFKEHNFPIITDAAGNSTINKESMWTGDELTSGISEVAKKSQDRSTIEQIIKLKLELYSRYNTPLSILAFILLGFALGIKPSTRSKNHNAGPVALIIVVIFFAITFFGIAMAKKGLLPPSIAIFTPTLITTILGMTLFKKIDWIS